jgi:hypothetical protein
MRIATQIAGRREGVTMQPRLPRFLVSVASKGVSISVSPLESTLTRTPASVASKRVRRIPRGLRDITCREGLEDVGATCAKRWTGYRQEDEEGEDVAR